MSNYQLNHESKTICISEEFEKNTREIGKGECETLIAVKEKFPDYVVKVVKNRGKRTFKYLTFAVMRLYITEISKDESVQEDFNKVMEYYKGETARYSLVKSWFLNRYPNITKEQIETLRQLSIPIITEEKRKVKENSDQKASMIADGIIREIDEVYARNPHFRNNDTAQKESGSGNVVDMPPAVQQESSPADGAESDGAA